MKKVQIILILLVLSGILLIPVINLAQITPPTCVKLGNDIKWTGAVDAKTNCSITTCTFKKGKIVGEGAFTSCGGGAAPVRCDTGAGVWNATNTQLLDCTTSLWGMLSMLNSLYTITNWIFIVLMILVGLLIIYGGITIATAGGSPEKATQGRTVILYALIGLAVALLSKALPSVVKALLGM